MSSPLNLNPADLVVTSFEPEAALSSISPKLPTTDPTAATFCYYCPPASFDAACMQQF